MRPLIACLLVIPAALVLEIHFASGQAKHQLKHDTTDAFKAFAAFPHAIAMFDADDDGDLDCLVSERQHVDENSKTASYVWILPPMNGRPAENHTYYWREGSEPDKPVFTADDGADGEHVGHIIYTDYENCAVVDVPFKNKQNCALWVIKEALHTFPQECVDHFEDNCDMTVSLFDEETCKEFLDNI